MSSAGRPKMDALQQYGNDSEMPNEDVVMTDVAAGKSSSLGITESLVVAPTVQTRSDIKEVAVIDRKTKEIKSNPTYEQLFKPESGPVNPFKSEKQRAQKNTLTGYVEPAHLNEFHFNREIRSFDTLGYARNPTAHNAGGFIGDLKKANEEKGISLFESKKTGGEKRKRVRNDDPSDVKVAVEFKSSPTYEQLFKPESGPVNPFESEKQRAQKNTLTGYVEPAHLNDDSKFLNDLMSFYISGPSPKQPTPELQKLFESKKTGGEKVNTLFEPRTYKNKKTIAKPELQKEMDEIVKKRQEKSRRFKKEQQDNEQMSEESTTLHLKETENDRGRSFLVPPSLNGVNLREDYVPERCFVPKKLVHTYHGHTKGVNFLQFFPKSAHLFLSCSTDTKIKLWEVYDRQRVVRTYAGHKLPVREVAFNNEGNEFLSASSDRYVKLWDTETGQVKQRFHTGHVPYCLKYHPDDDKNHMFLVGMQNKKIIQWDTRTGKIAQEYDRHLQAVNSITFFDKNRRFASTSDDKSVRIWEWGIPPETKLIQNVGLHAIPTMTKSPDDKWVVGQCMDNRIVLFQLVDDRLRSAKKKAFRGHNAAGYACNVDFSPDMSFLISGDADGKLFIWDWRTHKIVGKWKAHDTTCIASLWHPHEKSKMITAGWDGLIKMWN